MDERATHRFVADGHQRALTANGPRIEQEVRARYAGELSCAGPLERWRIEGRIRREIREELERVAPWGALY
ncbi:MAG TPA: hypothetical protein VFR03_05105 [Thermoanaerobaculia bacterium]|nr:hypothetical protein [Thermoanaerobaculia bacterium]